MRFAQTGFTLFCLITYFVAHALNGRLYRILTQEDNFGEFVQFTLLLCAIHLLWRARDLAGKLKPLLFLAMVFLFFVAGEEISWGQRFWQLQWPGLQSLNTQNELNLHNIVPLHGKIGPYIAASLLLGTLVPLILVGFSKFLRLSFTKADAIDAGLAAILMLVCFLGLKQADHVYFYEYTEVWIYGLFLLQLRILFRGLVTPPPLAPYLFTAMALSLWMMTPQFNSLF